MLLVYKDFVKINTFSKKRYECESCEKKDVKNEWKEKPLFCHHLHSIIKIMMY